MCLCPFTLSFCLLQTNGWLGGGESGRGEITEGMRSVQAGGDNARGRLAHSNFQSLQDFERMACKGPVGDFEQLKQQSQASALTLGI